MPIPTYGVEAHGGRIVTLDDEAVVKDLTDDAGSGGDAYVASVVPTPFDTGIGGWSTFRRMVQHVHQGGAVTVEITAIRDEQDTGQSITRNLTTSSSFVVSAPLKVGGTTFSAKVELSAFDAPAELGKSEQWLVPRRRKR
jgi:hypothetical protein